MLITYRVFSKSMTQPTLPVAREQAQAKERQVKRLKREVRRVRQESETATNEMQPQLRGLADALKTTQVRAGGGSGSGSSGGRWGRGLERGPSRAGIARGVFRLSSCLSDLDKKQRTRR